MERKWDYLVQQILDGLTGTRMQYELVRALIIHKHGYDVFRELQNEAFEIICSM